MYRNLNLLKRNSIQSFSRIGIWVFMSLAVISSALANSPTPDVVIKKSETSVESSAFCTPRLEFKNTGCNNLLVYWTNPATNALTLMQTVAPRQAWYVNTELTHIWNFHVGSVSIGTYEVVDCDNVNLGIQSGGCTTTTSCTPTIWVQNTGCQNLGIYKIHNGSEVYVTSISAGGSFDASATQGQIWNFKVNYSLVKQVVVTACGTESHSIDSGGCTTSGSCTSTLWFKNTGCQTIGAYNNSYGSETFVANISSGGTLEANAHSGQQWIFKVGSTVIKNFTVTSCSNETRTIDSGGCSYSNCTPNITFKNTGCVSMEAHRISGGSLVYVATIAAGGSTTVATTNGADWVFKVSGAVKKAWTVNTCYDRTWEIDTGNCSHYGCNTKVWYKNTGCESVKVYWDNNGYHHYFTTISSGATWGANTQYGHKWLFKVNNTIIANWTVNTCTEFSKDIHSGGCYSNNACNTKVWFKNTGCQPMKVYWDDNGYHRYYTTMQSGVTWGTSTQKGHKWLFKVGNTAIANWTVNTCAEFSKEIDSGGCYSNNACSTKVWFKNTGCQPMKVYWDDNGYHRYYTTMQSGVTWGASTKKGHKWLFKVGNTAVANWTVNTCTEFSKDIDSGGCQNTCRSKVTFKNSGCSDLYVYYNDKGSHVHFKTMTKSEYWTVNTYKNDEWIFKVNHNEIERWTAKSCYDESIAIKSGGCDDYTTTCEVNVIIKNTGCQTMKLFKEKNGSQVFVASLAADQKWNDITFKDQKWTFKVDDATVETWTVSKCEDISKDVYTGGCKPAIDDACLISYEGFEEGLGIWNDGGSDVWRTAYLPNPKTVGKYAVRIRDNNGIESSLYTDPLSLDSYGSVTIDFIFVAESMETSEDFLLEYSLDGGDSYTEAQKWVRGTDFENSKLYSASTTVEAAFNDNTVFRFRCDAYDDLDKVFIDEVYIYSCDNDNTDSGDGGNDNGTGGDTTSCAEIVLEIDNDGDCDVQLYLDDVYLTDLSSSDFYKKDVTEGAEYVIKGINNDNTDSYTVGSDCNQKWEFSPNCDTISTDCTSSLVIKNNGDCILDLIKNDTAIVALDPAEEWTANVISGEVYIVRSKVNQFSSTYTTTEDCNQSWDITPDCTTEQSCSISVLIENDGECSLNLLLNGETSRTLEAQEEWTTLAQAGDTYMVTGLDNDYTSTYTVTDSCDQKWEIAPECTSGADSGSDTTNTSAGGNADNCDSPMMMINNNGICDVLLYVNGLYKNRILTNSGWREEVSIDDKLEIIGVTSFYYTSHIVTADCDQEWVVMDDECTGNVIGDKTETTASSRSKTISSRGITSNTIGSDKLNVFPNPTHGEITIDGLQDTETYNVFSLDGRSIHQRINTRKLDVTDLENGVYIIKTTEGKVSRFVKF